MRDEESHCNLEDDDLADRLSRMEVATQSSGYQIRVFVLGNELSHLSERLLSHLGERLVALIDGVVISAIYAAESLLDKKRTLVGSLARSVGRYALSPYTVGSPAYGSRFFGRNHPLLRMIGGRTRGNYVIVGSRRIGKTSLLREIRHRLVPMATTSLMADVYGGSCSCTEDFLITTMMALGVPLPSHSDKKSLIRHFMEFMNLKSRPIIVFVDELDPIIEWDSNQRFEVLELL